MILPWGHEYSGRGAGRKGFPDGGHSIAKVLRIWGQQDIPRQKEGQQVWDSWHIRSQVPDDIQQSRCTAGDNWGICNLTPRAMGSAYSRQGHREHCVSEMMVQNLHKWKRCVLGCGKWQRSGSKESGDMGKRRWQLLARLVFDGLLLSTHPMLFSGLL